MLRYAVVLVAFLILASAASATCLTCAWDGSPDYWGHCEPWTGGRCTYTCCLWDAGTPCYVFEQQFNCVPDDPSRIPSVYFASKLPLHTEGSALRLRLGKGIPVREKCSATTLLRQQARS